MIEALWVIGLLGVVAGVSAIVTWWTGGPVWLGAGGLASLLAGVGLCICAMLRERRGTRRNS